jgi:hypothetical protein
MAPSIAIKEDVGIPVYALEWQDDANVVACGGGGIGKSGVKNKIVFSFSTSFDNRSS